MTISKFISVPFTYVTIEDAFWAQRIKTTEKETIPHIYQKLKETGRINAFKLDWKPGKEPVPHLFWDSDVAKWIESVSYCLANNPDSKLERLLDKVINLIVSAQQPDGYLNIYFTVVEPRKRWVNLRDNHELYCAGHLIESAVAHYQATGKKMFLDAMCKYADYIEKTFGTDPGKKRGYCGHPEIELALVRLYRVTGEKRYLNLSKYFLDERGQQPHYYDIEAHARGEDPKDFWLKTYEYNQSHIPVRKQKVVVGHAVRAMYLYSAMADLVYEFGDRTLLLTCRRLWKNLCTKRMYITGGIGSLSSNEGFTSDYDLPNEAAYCETCAAIGLVLWNHRLLQIDCDSRYADVMERALYNGVLSGISLNGIKFSYKNPLASLGGHHRQEWLGCACCPPNVARLLSSLGGYIYSQDEKCIVIHLYIQGSGRFNLDGNIVTLRQETKYPWDGKVTVHFEMEQPMVFALKVRIPEWCRKAKLQVNGKSVEIPYNKLEKGYINLRRKWEDGDCITLNMPMPIERVYAYPDVRQNVGYVSLQRGPLVYCLEEVDNIVPLHRIFLPRDAELKIHFDKTLLGGIIVINGKALAIDDRSWNNMLYCAGNLRMKPCKFTAVPYYTWDNRQAGQMCVWIPEERIRRR